MKKILLLTAAVAALMVTSCKQNAEQTAQAATATETVVSNQVAYINIDSLVSGYNMYIDLRSAYEVKAKKAETELTSKGRALEKDVADFQEKIQKGLVTRAQAAELEEKLNKKQQSFVQNRDRLMSELAEEERVMLNRIQYSIVKYLEKFNSDYKYGMIISTNAAGPVLNANPALDITAEVLKGLNEDYKKSPKE